MNKASEKINNRTDVLAKVTGAALYVNDMHLPGQVYAKVVRSTISYGKILKIDTEEADKMPGVIRIFTAKDIPGAPSTPCDRPALCPEIVRYIGDGVALVAAETLEQAEAAARAVKVEYEEWTPILDPHDSLKEGAPEIHPGGNTICRWNTIRGDVEKGFAEADHIVERSYSTPRVQHACIETEAAIANYDPISEEILIYCPVNSPFVIRQQVAGVMGMPVNQVRVIVGNIGASFGGKNYDTAMASARAALVSYYLKRPCKVVLSREESVEEGTKRHPIFADYKVGLTNDGRITAMEIEVLLDGGSYKSKSFPVTTRMAIEATGPYRVENVHTVSRNVYTNNVYSDALRGFGSPQVDFCSESLMDELAAVIGMDPFAFRKKNMFHTGDPHATGAPLKDVTLDKCVEALEKAVDIPAKRQEFADWNASHTFTKKGIGFGFLHRGESFGAAGQGIDTASSFVSLNPDGSLNVECSIAEVGQGGRTMIINVATETLGIPRHKIRTGKVDTSYLLDAGPTVATRGTVFSGGSVWKACLQLKARLAGYAEKYLGTSDPEAMIFADEKITLKADPEKSVALIQCISDAFANREHLNEIGFFAAPPFNYDNKTGTGEAYLTYVYGAACAEVTVDTRTGAVSVDHYTAVHDVGHALDMEEVKGQIRGGVAMGIGYGLTEEIDLAGGKIRNLNLENYILPTMMDVPDIDAIALEYPSAFGPLGAKGLGEPATSNVAPTVVNAIADACGRRVRDLPANLEQVLLGHAVKKK